MSNEFLDSILNAQTTDRNPYFVPGEYVLECKKCEIFTARNGTPFWLFEGEIISFNGTGEGGKAFVPGSRVSTMTRLNNDVGPGNVQKFCVATYKQLAHKKGKQVSQVTASSLDKKTIGLVVDAGADSVAVGLRFRASCVTVKLKNGSDFDAVKFYPALDA